MRLLLTIFCFIACSCFSETWKQSWEKGIVYFNENNFEEAEVQFTEAINRSRQEGSFEPHLCVDRAKVYNALGKYQSALSDLEVVLGYPDIEITDKLSALMAKNYIYVHLDMSDEKQKNLEEIKKIYPFPKAEFSADKIVIRDVPDSGIFRDLIKVAYKNDEVTFLPSGVCLIKKKG